MAYAPEPPFNSGTPPAAPPESPRRPEDAAAAITNRRLQTAIRLAAGLGGRDRRHDGATLLTGAETAGRAP